MAKNWIVLMIMTITTVVIWIVLEISIGFFSQEVEEDYEEYLDPMPDSFDLESLDEIQTRESEQLLIDRDALE